MPWILISKYSSLYLTPPPRCVSHAWLDREAISSWITTQPASCFGKSFTYPVLASYPKLFFFFFPFFLLFYQSTYCTFTCTDKLCVTRVSARCSGFFCGPKRCRGIWLSCPAQQARGVQYPIVPSIRVRCWQDVSAGQRVCSRASSDAPSAPSLHYHNATGSVKRPAVIWKGNYLLWNLLKQAKSRGRRGGRGWVGVYRRGQLIERWKIRLLLLATCEWVNGSEVCNELISIWTGREGEAETHKMTFWWISNCLFSPWPHFVARNRAFIYLFTSFLDAVNSIHFFTNGQDTLHQEQGQPQCDIWRLRGLLDDANEIQVS